MVKISGQYLAWILGNPCSKNKNEKITLKFLALISFAQISLMRLHCIENNITFQMVYNILFYLL